MTEAAPPPHGRLWSRLILLGLPALAVGAFYALGLHRSLNWEQVRTHLDQIRDTAWRNLPLALLLYIVLYAVVTGLSLPVATALTVAGGAIFGLWVGSLGVSLGSTLGATLAFLSSRYLFRAVAQRWLGSRLEAIDRGVLADGALYVLTLRLVPVFPFVLVNIALGLTQLRVGTFWWASQLGMLPLTVVYVNVGAELGAAANLADILSTRVVASLVLVAVAPWLIRGLVRLLKAR